jgi:AbrB family looped-hinge helix DNA binding protein
MNKMYYSSSVSPKGQITLPAEFRKALGIEPKDVVVITVEGDKISVEKAESQLLSDFGSVPLPNDSRSWKEIERDAIDDAAERNVRKWLTNDGKSE